MAAPSPASSSPLKSPNALGGKGADQKTAVAGGIASLVVILLFIGWAVYFMDKLRKGEQDVTLGGIQNQINLREVQEANRDIESQFQNERMQEYQQLRESAAAQDAGTTNLEVMEIETGAPKNQFNSAW